MSLDISLDNVNYRNTWRFQFLYSSSFLIKWTDGLISLKGFVRISINEEGQLAFFICYNLNFFYIDVNIQLKKLALNPTFESYS